MTPKVTTMVSMGIGRATLRYRQMTLLASIAIIGLVVITSSSKTFATDQAPRSALTAKDSAFVKNTINTSLCPCGCGNNLPGSDSSPVCFGCSVGKAEIARLEEGLATGHSRAELLIRSQEQIIIDVFSDYSDSKLSATWDRALRAAAETGQHRVVLRTPGRTEIARRAVAAAECARLQGRFAEMQRALIDHRGPWDVAALADMAERIGMDRGRVMTCIMSVDIHPQILKDREHAANRSIHRYPTITINREKVIDQEAAMRRVIRRLLSDDSL